VGNRIGAALFLVSLGLITSRGPKASKVDTMGVSRITLPYPLFVAGCIALFAAGVNVCLLALVFTGRLTCKVQSDPGAYAMHAMPHAWCPAHGGRNVVGETLKQHQPGQLVIDVGAYDGQEAIQYARAGHKVHLP
jgi:hypothetical protein